MRLPSKRPTILVATSYVLDTYSRPAVQLPATYVSSVIKAGGVPLLVPPMEDGPAWRHLVNQGDALLLVGGADIDPAAYGQKPHPKTKVTLPERQAADARLFAWADRRKLPIMGICLGIQTVAVARGATLIQDIPDEWPGAIEHACDPSPKAWPRHPVRIDPNSQLARIVGGTELSVNSHHHQGLASPGRNMRAVAWSPDGIIEATEDVRADRFVLGIQWHPERICDEPPHLALFKKLVHEARVRRKS